MYSNQLQQQCNNYSNGVQGLIEFGMRQGTSAIYSLARYCLINKCRLLRMSVCIDENSFYTRENEP